MRHSRKEVAGVVDPSEWSSRVVIVGGGVSGDAAVRRFHDNLQRACIHLFERNDWHHEGRRARMGSFMQGPDYVQWHGFYELLQDRVEIEHMAEDIRAEAEDGPGNGDGEDDDDETDWIAWSIPIAMILGFVILAVAVTRKG